MEHAKANPGYADMNDLVRGCLAEGEAVITELNRRVPDLDFRDQLALLDLCQRLQDET